jgi:hypothetical protein
VAELEVVRRLTHVNRATAILLSCLVLIIGSVAFVRWPQGHKSVFVTDLSRPFTVAVSSPTWLSGSGALFVIVEGQCDGDAVLDIISNHGRDRRQLLLHGPQISTIIGGAEEWVEDLEVQYRPGTAKTGQLYVALYCGDGFTPTDFERFYRISRKRQ